MCDIITCHLEFENYEGFHGGQEFQVHQENMPIALLAYTRIFLWTHDTSRANYSNIHILLYREIKGNNTESF